jgi:Mrp family chromosome partitioning ATPase
MSDNCSHDCNSCGSDCADRKDKKTDFSLQPHEMSNIKKVIGVVSGKGGVGKSLVTSLMAVIMNRRGYLQFQGTGLTGLRTALKTGFLCLQGLQV